MSDPERVTRNDDPTLVRNQPALTRSSGRSWLIVGTIASVLIVGLFIVLWLQLNSALALTAAIVTFVFFAAMIISRLAITPRRPRLIALAVLFWTQVLFALVAVAVIAFTTDR